MPGSQAVQLWRLWRHFGSGWFAYRLRHATQMRLGLLRRAMPVTTWAQRPLAHFLSDPTLADPEAYYAHRLTGPHFFFRPDDRAAYAVHFRRWDEAGHGPQERVQALSQGRLAYFGHLEVQVGCPPDWPLNPFTGQRAPDDRHWSLIGDFALGDIKVIWEPSRFSFVYDLVRAHWRTADDDSPELFWRLIEDWRAHNPPHQGPNWKCGQETAFRVMAWCFGLYGFLDHPASTPQRVADLAQMVAVSGERIAGHLDYALSQRNNHGISEAVGLWTVGLLFPEFRRAAEWRAVGRRVLERLARELIYEDGGFAQHSTNYHRVMLDDYLWALALGDLQGDPLSDALRERVGRAGEFLHQLLEPSSGRAPCFGGNDGAQVLPLSNCDYRDYRPVVQAAFSLTRGRACLPPGPWDEQRLWLAGPPALELPVESPPGEAVRAPTSGCYALRSPEGSAFIRCAAYRHRPAHADQLHVDLWWRGQNVALDPGTYSYNAPAPWDTGLADTAYHNTVSVDGCDQMDRVGRFLFLPWSRGRVRGEWQAPDGETAYWEGEHDGYGRLKARVGHRRGVLRLPGDCWVIVDELESASEHQYCLHWLLCDAPYDWEAAEGRLTLQTPAGACYVQLCASSPWSASLVRADPESPRGWQAPYYAAREPALSLHLTTRAARSLLVSVFGPTPTSCGLVEAGLRLEGLGLIRLDTSAGAPLLIPREQMP